MSLATPEKIRSLQRKLYRKAKAEPAFCFYLLYDKIHREDTLRHAYALARANAGAPGVDGVTFAAIEASGLEGWLAGLHEDLVSKTFFSQTDAVAYVYISLKHFHTAFLDVYFNIASLLFNSQVVLVLTIAACLILFLKRMRAESVLFFITTSVAF